MEKSKGVRWSVLFTCVRHSGSVEVLFSEDEKESAEKAVAEFREENCEDGYVEIRNNERHVVLNARDFSAAILIDLKADEDRQVALMVRRATLENKAHTILNERLLNKQGLEGIPGMGRG